MVDPSCSPIPQAPSLEQLLMLLAERDVALTQRDALIAVLASRVAERGSAVGQELQELLQATQQRWAGQARTEVVAEALRAQAG